MLPGWRGELERKSANTKSNYKTGWHHSAWWPCLPGALGVTAEPGVPASAVAAEGWEAKKTKKTEEEYVCLIVRECMCVFVTINGVSWVAPGWFVCACVCGTLPEAHIWVELYGRQAPAEPFLFQPAVATARQLDCTPAPVSQTYTHSTAWKRTQHGQIHVVWKRTHNLSSDTCHRLTMSDCVGVKEGDSSDILMPRAVTFLSLP